MATIYLGNKQIQEMILNSDFSQIIDFFNKWEITNDTPLKIDMGTDTDIRIIEMFLYYSQQHNIPYQVINARSRFNFYMRMASENKLDNNIIFNLKHFYWEIIGIPDDYTQEILCLKQWLNINDVNPIRFTIKGMIYVSLIPLCIKKLNRLNIPFKIYN